MPKENPGRGPQVREWQAREGDDREADSARDAQGDPRQAEADTFQPQPEPGEARLENPGLRDLSFADYKAIVLRAGKGAWERKVTDLAAALAYHFFTSIPALLLVLVGVFSIVASPEDVARLMERLQGVVPGEAISLLEDTLLRVVEGGGGGALIGIGLVVALWSATSAMTALMRGLNAVYGRKETRGFVKQRVTALGMLAGMFLALVLVFGLLVLGPVISDLIGSALGMEDVFGWIWWTVQWPVLIGGLLLAFAAVLYLGPNLAERHFRFLSLGALVAAVLWLVASGLFALYVANFSSYNETWGSLAAVIIMLTWLWLSSLAILLGGAINAEARRSRELREGLPSQEDLQAPAKA